MKFLGALAQAPRTLALLCVGFAFAGALAGGCKKPEPVTFDIVLPVGVQPSTVWLEVGIFKGTRCTAVAPQLTGGIPQDGPVRRLAFRADDAHPPALGVLDRDKYT